MPVVFSYLTLGMSKRKISLILFFETLIIGVISLGVGLALGIVLSQLMSILVANMFEADLTKFQFTFSSSAALKTLLYFSIMYLIVMIFNTIIVNKCKLIDLLHGNKKSEKVKLKNPIICTIVFIIAVIALSYAYYLVTDGFGTSPLMNAISGILIPIALCFISTFIIFWSISFLILNIVMHLKKYYYKGLNSFTVRQISSKINTTVFSMTIICLMLFFTICIFSSALSIKNSLSGNLKDLAPVDIQFSKLQEPLSKEEQENFSKDIIEDYNTTVKDTLQRLDVYKYLKDVVDINIYRVEEITLKDSFGDQIEQIRKDYPLLAYQDKETLIKLSDYNRLAKLYNKKELTLKDNEYVIIANYKMMAGIRNISLKNNTKLTINGKDYYPKYQECQDGFIELSGSATNTGVIILPDNALEGIHPYKNILAANYPFATIEPNVGMVTVPDERLDFLNELIEPKSLVPTTFEFTDIAGLVKGASHGEGLGNKFLSHIREVDAIVEVVRCFDDSNITHVEGGANPLRDTEIIDVEFIFCDLEVVDTRLGKIEKKAVSTKDKDALKEVELLKRIKEALENNIPARKLEYTEDDLKILKAFNLLTMKPIIYVANIKEDEIGKENSYVKDLKDHANKDNAEVIVLCAKIEEELSGFEDVENKAFLNDLGIEESGLDKLIRASYHLLGLQTYFTAGPKEVRAWTFKKGMKAPACAGIIHSDFEKGFIRAEVISFDDYKKYKGEKGAKEAGKLRSEGKEYVMQDGDVCLFRFNN